MIKYLAQEEVPTNSKAEVTQHFYGDLCRLVQTNAIWREASKEELDGSMDAVEKYIFGKVNIFVYQPADVDDQLQDKLFHDKAASLSKLSPTDLAVYLGRPGESEGEDHGEAPDLHPAAISKGTASALTACPELQSPIEKLDALVGLVKHCALETGGGAGSADLLLPTLVQLILREAPRTLISDVRYIQRFRNHARLVGEASYCLTNMVAVITMIEKIYAEQVAKSDPIYSMLASQDNLLLGGAPTAVQAASKKAQAHSSTALAPSSDINSMASSFINTIGFVPRAIGSAVADTFRSRSSAAQAASREKLFSSPDARRRGSVLPVGDDASVAVPLEIHELRKKIVALSPQQTGGITLHEMELVIEDYRRLLAYFM